MKTIIISIVLLGLTNLIFAQLTFNKLNVSDKILNCIYEMDNVTKNPNFDNIDTMRAEYSDLIWMKLPYATDEELLELTNYKNKFVRLQSFELLLTMRDRKNKIVLQILEKNKNDTLEKVEKVEGCLVYEMTVFERMMDLTKDKIAYVKKDNKESYFTDEENLRWIKLRNLIKD